MKVYDENDLEIASPDLERGYLVEAQRFVAHHEAVEAVTEVGHYETIAEYPNGGKDVAWIIDTPGVAAKDAWDEFETVQIYHTFTADEIAARNAPTQLDRIEAQVTYTAMMTDTLLGEVNDV